MNAFSAQLYQLLPEFIRRQDAEQGEPGLAEADRPYPLRQLFDAAQTQADVVAADIQQLWDNFFVETCEPWVLPYLADLIALNFIADDPASNRREVARTIAYRRRKGTVPQLETLARDVTGYDFRVVEFFTRLIWNQSLIHLRPDALTTVDVRRRGQLGRIGSAFDVASHTVDVRPSTQTQGWHNIRKIGFFLWRLGAIPLSRVTSAAAPAPAPVGRAFHFSVLGQPMPLWQSPDALERGADADWPRTIEPTVDSPISPLLFRESPGLVAQVRTGFSIYRNGAAAVPAAVIPANLCQWTEPPPGRIAVDVRLGRFLFANDIAPAPGERIETDHYFGLSGSIGGGGYERQETLSPRHGETPHLVRVAKAGPINTIQAALNALAASVNPLRVVQIDDSGTYEESLTLPPLFTDLVIQAANGQRPTLRFPTAGAIFGGPTAGQRLALRGLLIAGTGETLVLPPGIPSFIIEDCTVDPGGGLAADAVSLRPAGVTIQVPAPGTGVSLRIDRSIVGRFSLPETMDCLSLSECIVDAQNFAHASILVQGPPATVERTTLFGDFECQRLEASESVFTGVTLARHRQQGCVRFCYFAPGSRVPRRYRCAPESPPPVFTSTWFGQPGYAQLALNAPPAIAAHGDNDKEMGVWAPLKGPRRLAHLRLRLEEYLPAGLVPVFVFVT